MSTKDLVFSSDSYLKFLSLAKGHYRHTEHHSVTDGIVTAHAESKVRALRLYHVHVHALSANEVKDYNGSKVLPGYMV